MISSGCGLEWKRRAPLQVVGTISSPTRLCSPNRSRLQGHLPLHDVANASFGLPDLAITSLNDVCEGRASHHLDHRRAAAGRCRHGLGAAFNIIACSDLIRSGAGVCLEGQVMAKRCGHRQAKAWCREGRDGRSHQEAAVD